MPFLHPSLPGCPLAEWLTGALPVWIPLLRLLRRQLEIVIFKNSYSTQTRGRGCSRVHVLREMKVSAHPLAVSKAPALSQHRAEHWDKHRAELLQPQTPVLLLQHQARLWAPPHQPSMPRCTVPAPLVSQAGAYCSPISSWAPPGQGWWGGTKHPTGRARQEEIKSCLPG